MQEQNIDQIRSASDTSVQTKTRKDRSGFLDRILTNQKIVGYLFISPWFIGFMIWTLGPFLASIGLSLLDWGLLGAWRFVGLGNYQRMFMTDGRYRTALMNTFMFVIVTVPLRQVIALCIALLVNQALRGIFIYRTVFYLPSVTSGVATAILWTQIFGFRLGIFNAFLERIGIPGQPWLTSIQWALPTLMFISLWNVGSTFIIYLAGLVGVPRHYYEAAEVDGATVLQRFRKITIPLITPTIFFNVVMGFIGSFQVFTDAYVMTGGGPADRTLFYVLYLYFRAFRDFRMGYAAAMAWVLFLIILMLTIGQIKLSQRWVYYEGAAPTAQQI